MLFVLIIQLFLQPALNGIIHSWFNRMLLPNTVGTVGDSNNGIPLGISFPAGYGLVNLGIATGIMPLNMPNTVLVVVLFCRYHCSGHSLIRKYN